MRLPRLILPYQLFKLSFTGPLSLGNGTGHRSSVTDKPILLALGHRLFAETYGWKTRPIEHWDRDPFHSRSKLENVLASWQESV